LYYNRFQKAKTTIKQHKTIAITAFVISLTENEQNEQ